MQDLRRGKGAGRWPARGDALGAKAESRDGGKFCVWRRCQLFHPACGLEFDNDAFRVRPGATAGILWSVKVPTIPRRKQGVVCNAPKAGNQAAVAIYVAARVLHGPERGAYRQILAPGSSQPASPRHGVARGSVAPGGIRGARAEGGAGADLTAGDGFSQGCHLCQF